MENDLSAFAEKTREILAQLAKDKTRLRKQVLATLSTPSLFRLCEHYDILDKVILADGLMRIRLHIFAKEYFDRPHNHRWSYSSWILSGGYEHVIYTLKEEVDCPQVQDITPVMIREEKAGQFYTLHSSQYHSVIAKPNTVTLIARGRPDCDRFRLIDRVTKQSWWQYGAAVESQEEQEKKKMTKSHFYRAIETLEKLEII